MRFAAARERLSLTLKQLEKEVGVSFQTIQRWEKGERIPERSNAIRLAEICGEDFGQAWLKPHAQAKPVITPSSRELLSYFNRLAPDRQAVLIEIAREFVQGTATQKSAEPEQLQSRARRKRAS